MMFISEKQLIFRITVKGSPMIVVFSEISNGAKSRFFTSNTDVADAIRAHKFYREGKIFETPEQRTEQRTEQRQAPLAEGRETIEFRDISKAKTWLKKTYGSEAQALRTPQEITDFGKKKNIIIKIGI